MLQIVFIVLMDFVVVVTKIKGVCVDTSKMSVVLSQNLSVNTVKNLCLGIVHYKNIKLFVLRNMFFS